MFSARRFFASRRCSHVSWTYCCVTRRLITTNNNHNNSSSIDNKNNDNANKNNVDSSDSGSSTRNLNSNSKFKERLFKDTINTEVKGTVIDVSPSYIPDADIRQVDLVKVAKTFLVENSASTASSCTSPSQEQDISNNINKNSEKSSTAQSKSNNKTEKQQCKEEEKHEDDKDKLQHKECKKTSDVIDVTKHVKNTISSHSTNDNTTASATHENIENETTNTTSNKNIIIDDADAAADTENELKNVSDKENNEQHDMSSKSHVYLHIPPAGFEQFYSHRFMSYLPMPLRPRQAIERALSTPSDEKELIRRIRDKKIGDRRKRQFMCLIFALMAYLGYRQARWLTLAGASVEDYHYVEVNLKHNSATYYDAQRRKIAIKYFIDYDTFLSTCDPDKDVVVTFSTPYPWLPMFILALMPVAAIIGSKIERQSVNAVMQSATAAASRFKFKRQLGVETRLKDVAGLMEAKREVVEVIDFLKQPTRYTTMGARLPKGVLLDGPPGVGKTLLAKAVAGEAMVPFVSCSGSEFEEVYVGVGAQRVRELFREAHHCKPCVVFIDEVDTVGRKRQGSRGNSRSTLNALLAEMDGFKDSSGIIVLAATNRADTLDKAFTRSGRFDRKIKLELPSYKDRVDVAQVHLKPLKLAPVPSHASKREGYAETIAALTPGCSGADIFNICNEAAIIAARDDASCIALHHFHRAIERVLVGLERSAVRYLPHERERIAYHEAGVVVLNWFMRLTDPVLKTTILPRGRHRTGITQRLPQNLYISTEERLHEKLIGKLGGYGAEEFFFNDVSTSAAGDLQEATSLAQRMVCEYGMLPNEIGHMGYELNQEDSLQKPFGPAKENAIDVAVEQIVQTSLQRARSMIKEHEQHIRLVASKLLQVETLTAHELRALLGDRPVMSKEFITYLESEEESDKGDNNNNNDNNYNNDSISSDNDKNSMDEEKQKTEIVEKEINKAEQYKQEKEQQQ